MVAERTNPRKNITIMWNNNSIVAPDPPLLLFSHGGEAIVD